MGWWRVDPATGETLGQILDGRGSSLVEEIVTTTISAVFLGIGSYQCWRNQQQRNQNRFTGGRFWDNQGACCLVANGGVSWIAYLVGTFFLVEATITSLTVRVGLSAEMDVIGYRLPLDELCGSVVGN